MEIKKSPYRFVTSLHPGNNNGRWSGTSLTGNHCVTVPVIVWGVLTCFVCTCVQNNTVVFFSLFYVIPVKGV